MLKRTFDIIFSFLGLLLLTPFIIIISIIIKAGSTGPAFYIQSRVGRNNKDFGLYKFRSMKKESDRSGLLTVGDRDPRITGAGYYLRKYKLDEIPQLLNVFKGDMSFVGPRPEVRKYVVLYSEEQMKVLNVRPGITDPASIKYRNENELLAGAENPEKYYVNEIMPDKIRINLEYLNDRSFFSDVKIILKTLKALVK
ncbi:MAG TPA: sugar transferase [Ignavibacteria bacterium]|nr:glycosyl transferase [Bacteroidota bacterium]HRI84454.1 sugar transferase [Ignavibacteria bacterium]HRJ98551.1 sugar transferase [Ignavibacteria bacterium]